MLESKFRGNGINTVRLEVDVKNIVAVRFYKSLGYEVFEPIRKY
jgi:ribosomal protein S18 acetylase RimI-like enzyme